MCQLGLFKFKSDVYFIIKNLSDDTAKRICFFYSHYIIVANVSVSFCFDHGVILLDFIYMYLKKSK